MSRTANDKRGAIASAMLGKESASAFYLILVYLFLEYGRPQRLLTFLNPLHLPAVTLGLLGLSVFFSGRMQLQERQTKLYLLLLLLMIVHGPIAVNNYWALKIFITMSLNFIIFIAIANVVNDEGRFGKLLAAWFAIHVFLAVLGIVNQGVGIGGFLGDENDFCMTLNMVIPFSFFLAVSETGRKRIYYVLITCLFLFVVFLTKSRGGFVGLCATGVYLWLRSKNKLAVTGLVLFLVIFAASVAPKSYWDRIRSITQEGTTAGTGELRMYHWRVAWTMFLDNPVIGVGQGNYPWEFRTYEVKAGFEKGIRGRSLAGRVAHSIYFTILSELGIVGALLFLGMLYFSIRDINYVKAMTQGERGGGAGAKLGKQYYIALALEGSLITYLVSSVFISTFYYPNFWILMGFIIAYRKIVSSRCNIRFA